MGDWLDGLGGTIAKLLALNVDLVRDVGYPGIVLMMFIESSFIPFPSEVVVPPAGFLAARGEMSFTGVMLSSIAGSLLGAWLNYWIGARADGFLRRHGKWFLVSEKNLVRAEHFFKEHGEIGTIVGRLIPGVRQLISIPAGLARMNLAWFSFYTGIGAGVWCLVLFGIGYKIGEHGDTLDLELVKTQARDAFLYGCLPAIVGVVAFYVWRRRRRPAPPADGGGGAAVPE
jgi:membrane protein DedA with SNARE-associated domain